LKHSLSICSAAIAIGLLFLPPVAGSRLFGALFTGSRRAYQQYSCLEQKEEYKA